MCIRDSTTAAPGAAISFASGISMVLSRTANARLAEKTGALQGSLVNHLTGLPITVGLALAAAAISGTPVTASAGGSFRLWIYLGGALGVIVVMLLNITVPKIPGFQLTLLVFVGQVFTGKMCIRDSPVTERRALYSVEAKTGLVRNISTPAFRAFVSIFVQS